MIGKYKFACWVESGEEVVVADFKTSRTRFKYPVLPSFPGHVSKHYICVLQKVKTFTHLCLKTTPFMQTGADKVVLLSVFPVPV
jgi:hypothetical protein